jgi:hypothetical protein
MYDEGVDISAYMDDGFALRPGRPVQRVNVDFPIELLRPIDARRLRVTRQAFITIRMADSLRKP